MERQYGTSAKHQAILDKGPIHQTVLPISQPQRRPLIQVSFKEWLSPSHSSLLKLAGLACFMSCLTVFSHLFQHERFLPVSRPRTPDYAVEILMKCQIMKALPGPPLNFSEREASERFVFGTPATLIRNATIWTGGRNGTEVVNGDLLLDKGIVQAVGYIPPTFLESFDEEELAIIDAGGAWVTPGLFDLHSHLGVMSAPVMRGTFDLSSPNGPIQPWDLSLDGINVHDAALPLSISGGVTSALILPGSANAIGGQAVVIKLRETAEHSPSSMVLEMPFPVNTSKPEFGVPPRWRHIKHAVGENPSTYNSQTRLDTAWQYRQAYNEARKVKDAQDRYCALAEQGLWDEIPEAIPESFEWEALVDVLRGKTKVNIHCYTATDFDAVVRLSNEFQFPISAFHHASQAFFLTDLLEKTYGGKPAIAMFAVSGKWKMEAYRGSEYAPKILADKGFQVVMKSDHAVIDSRHLIHEAAQAHYYGLHPALALASVTTVPAEVAGLGHRLGMIKERYDADIVVWDSHPLALGATPKQVFIDGIPQIKNPKPLHKPESFQSVPITPKFSAEAKRAIEYQGLPPLEPTQKKAGKVILTNVGQLWSRQGRERVDIFQSHKSGVVVVVDGKIECVGSVHACERQLQPTAEGNATMIDLRGGTLAPGLMAFGSPLGLEEIAGEPSTNDGRVNDLLDRNGGLHAELPLIRAVDGLSFGGRNALQAYRSGVTVAITSPVSSGTISGLSTAWRLGSINTLDPEAVVQGVVALHVKVGCITPGTAQGYGVSVSTEIATLRKLLLEHTPGDAGFWFEKAAKGEISLVVNVAKADHMASLIHLKREVDGITGQKMRMVFAVATEAHLIARQISEAGVGVVLLPARPFPTTWDHSRLLPGPPLTSHTSFTTLLKHGVVVGLGVSESVLARNLRFDLGWTALDSNGTMTQQGTMNLVTTNIEKLLGMEQAQTNDDIFNEDMVIYEGGDPFSFQSKVLGVISPASQAIELFI